MFVFDVNLDAPARARRRASRQASTVYSSTLAIEEMLPRADLVIGAVLVHGRTRPGRDPPRPARADEAKRRARGRRDRPGRLLRDLAPDHPPRPDLRGRRRDALLRREHARRRPVTSTYALTNATLPYVLALADLGVAEAMRARSRACGSGVNVAAGQRHPPRGRGSGRRGVRSSDAGARPEHERARPAERDRREMATARPPRLQNFIDGELTDAAERRDRGRSSTRPRASRSPRRRSRRRRGRRPRRRGRAPRLRGLVATDAGRPRPRRCSSSPTRSRSTPRSSPTSRPPTPASRATTSSRTRSRSRPTTCASSPAPRACSRARRRASTWRGTPR